jgi:hypothetical protein
MRSSTTHKLSIRPTRLRRGSSPPYRRSRVLCRCKADTLLALPGLIVPTEDYPPRLNIGLTSEGVSPPVTGLLWAMGY